MPLETYTRDFEAGAPEGSAWHRGGDVRGVGTWQASSPLPVPFLLAPSVPPAAQGNSLDLGGAQHGLTQPCAFSLVLQRQFSAGL